MTRLAVYCGSHPGRNPAYLAAGTDLGVLLAQRHIGLVYGGGGTGIMGAIADAVLGGGGQVLGVIPTTLVVREAAHKDVQDMRVVDGMHPRKLAMIESSDAFCALPGGMGTLDELCEVLTWAQLGLHEKPIGVLNIENYFDPLFACMDHMVEEGFLMPKFRALVKVADHPQELLETLGL